jgi:hypothetical protein
VILKPHWLQRDSAWMRPSLLNCARVKSGFVLQREDGVVHSAAVVGSKLRRFMGIRLRRFNSSVLERGHDLLASSGVLLPAVRVHSALRATRDCISGEGSSACANARISTYHRCVPTRPLLLIVRLVYDSSGQPVYWSEPVSPSMASLPGCVCARLTTSCASTGVRL